MVRTKMLASKKPRAQSMDSRPDSPVLETNPRVTEVEIVEKEPTLPEQRLGAKVTSEKEKDSDSDEFETLALPQEKEANQPSITSFFSRTPVKQPAETKGIDKGKEKEGDERKGGVQTRKMKPRKSSGRPPVNPIIEEKEKEVPMPDTLKKSFKNTSSTEKGKPEAKARGSTKKKKKGKT